MRKFMKVLFLTLLDFDSLKKSNIYTDLLREFVKNEHEVYVISPSERRKKEKTHLIKDANVTILKLKIGNMQKTNVIEKGFSTLLVEGQFIRAIKRYYSDVKFDLVLYSTPPVTLVKAIEYVKKRDGARTYLMLKDIFPQNAVDLEMLSKNGVKGILYQYFRNKEKRLYEISDRIGCMSQANVDYVVKHNGEINPSKVEVCPNCVEVFDKSIGDEKRNEIRRQYEIPQDKMVFIYGGNLGKPQDIPFLIRCIEKQRDNEKVMFLIVGAGTEYSRFEHFIQGSKQSNVKLMKLLPKEEFELLAAACDVGMIFLDKRFTIPNYPSRLLSYMQAKLAVLACTDSNTDIGKNITEGEFGWWCVSDDADEVGRLIKKIECSELGFMREKSFEYLRTHFGSERCYDIIINSLK